MSVVRNKQQEMYIYGSLLIFLVGTVVGFGYLGYSWYRKSKEQSAYKELAEALEGYARASASQGSPNQWTDVLQALEVGSELHSSSSLYPFFLAYRADILGQQGKNAEALVLMDKALARMDKTNPLYYLYALKNGLMLIDSPDAAQIKKGRELVEALANDTTNPFQDQARYYSALDARSRGDEEAARQRLQQIIATQDEGSVWYKKALNSMR